MALVFLALCFGLQGHGASDESALILAEQQLGRGLLSEVESTLGEIKEEAPYFVRARAALLLAHVEGERQNYKNAESHYRAAEKLAGLVQGQDLMPDDAMRVYGAQLVDAAQRGLSWSSERRIRRDVVRQQAAGLRSQTLDALAIIAALLCLLAASSRSGRVGG